MFQINLLEDQRVFGRVYDKKNKSLPICSKSICWKTNVSLAGFMIKKIKAYLYNVPINLLEDQHVFDRVYDKKK